MFGTNAAWWNVATSPLVPCTQQWSCMAAMHPAAQAAFAAANPLTHVLNSDGRLGQEVFQHQSQQPPYFAPSMLDGQAVSGERLNCEQDDMTSGNMKLPSSYPALGNGGSGHLEAGQLHGLPVFCPMSPKDPYGSSVLHDQLHLKRKHATLDLDNADVVPCKTRVTDEKMAARLQGLSLSRRSASRLEGTATAAPFASATGAGAAAAFPARAGKPVAVCGALDAHGWKKFHEVEQRLAATEDSNIYLDCQETFECAQGASEAIQLECLRLELSPELHRQLAITELQTAAAMQSQRPQQSLALVLWKAPEVHWQEEVKQADEMVSSQGPASTKQIDGVSHAIEEEEEPLVELCEDANSGLTCQTVPTSTLFVGPEQGPSSLRHPCDTDGFMET